MRGKSLPNAGFKACPCFSFVPTNTRFMLRELPGDLEGLSTMWTADEIARLCYEHYGSRLPKQGKPEPNREWTLLAAVVKIQPTADQACDRSDGPVQVTKEVVSMGTGTKCIGQSKMRKSGDILNDSHAEVIARRSFQRYLLHQLHLAAALKEDSIFLPGSQRGLWKLRPDLLFVFFSSHTPCGDASIIPMLEFEDQPCCPVSRDWASNPSVETSDNLEAPEDKRKCEDPESPVTKKMRLEPRTPGGTAHRQSFGSQERGPNPPNVSSSNLTAEELASVTGMTPSGAQVVDVYRTGAKCVPGEAGDSGQPGAAYHRVGLLRVKPGRGDRTRSMSCSDKLARWNILGCQGALLMHFLEEPIYLSAVVIGKCPYSQEAMQRALIRRSRISKVELFRSFQKLLSSISEDKWPDSLRKWQQRPAKSFFIQQWGSQGVAGHSYEEAAACLRIVYPAVGVDALQPSMGAEASDVPRVQGGCVHVPAGLECAPEAGVWILDQKPSRLSPV
ncbi:tRNA-specific adenosine deaminase 1 isoform X9 [Bos mutus]|uniref:tRNA-specific adenosine deaminase 1 isoform X9 n=1 Tax=Bos mutus TaxID=72004 RepID=UPI0038B5EA2B